MAEYWSLRNFSSQLVVQGADLLLGNPQVNNVLWTMRYELLFSFMLPLFVLVAVVAKRYWLVVVELCILTSLIGGFNNAPSFTYLPIFMVGCVMAVHLDSIQTWVLKPSNAAKVRVGAPILLAVSLLLFTLHASVWGLFPRNGSIQQWAFDFEFLGAAGFVLAFAVWSPLAKLLSASIFRWLGRVSFSLYLVHMPIIVLVDKLIGPGHTLEKVAIAAVIALIVAEVFCRYVEQPLHRLSRRLGAASAKVTLGVAQ
jgi:peptidoglycan/LPS O-acetylase OafA/YrhL